MWIGLSVQLKGPRTMIPFQVPNHKLEELFQLISAAVTFSYSSSTLCITSKLLWHNMKRDMSLVYAEALAWAWPGSAILHWAWLHAQSLGDTGGRFVCKSQFWICRLENSNQVLMVNNIKCLGLIQIVQLDHQLLHPLGSCWSDECCFELLILYSTSLLRSQNHSNWLQMVWQDLGQNL